MSEVIALEPGPWVGVCPRGVDRKWGGRTTRFVCDYATPEQHGGVEVLDEECTKKDYKQMKRNFESWGNKEGQRQFRRFTRCPLLNNVTAYENREVTY